MTQQEMLFLVPQKLHQIEKDYGIHVLYAAESGSRAWGTASAHSDFDIRFIYIRPKEEYLRLDQTRDVLEFPIADSWDMCGWDLTKMLQLLHNSNSQIYEWFSSPVVYLDHGFSARLRPVLEEYFSARTMVNHYLHQAELKMNQALKADSPKVKHYLYTLQHLAAARWVLDRHSYPPVSYQALIPLLPDDIRQEAETLLLRKTTQSESPLMVHHLSLEAWAAETFRALQQEIQQMPKEEGKSWDRLNRFFLAELDQI